MEGHQSLKYTVWECKYNLVWIPKYRRKALYGQLRKYPGPVFKDLAVRKESSVLEGHLRPDHVHMLVSVPPKYSASQVVGFIKGKSAIHIARTYAGRRKNFTGQHFWARGYYVSTVGVDEGQVEGYVAKRAKNGTYYAGKQLVKEVQKAILSGKDELIDRAVRYWLYDRQKYILKRIVRTEAATAFHVSQIQATEHDPALIGYQWRLSSAHPRRDICDEWARVDQGLGAGVWSKDTIPRGRAHPHCMCYLVPRFGGK